MGVGLTNFSNAFLKTSDNADSRISGLIPFLDCVWEGGAHKIFCSARRM